MKRSFLSLTVLTLGLILSSNFSGLVKLSDDGAYAQEKVELSQCSDFKDKQEYAKAIQCFEEFIKNSQNQKELSEELSSAYYRLADTYYLDGQYINSYNLSSDKAKDRIEKDTDYRKALYYLLRANNQLHLGEYANAKSTINNDFPEKTFKTLDKKSDLITFYLSKGRIYTATAQINAANSILSFQDNSAAMKAYENARREILEKIVLSSNLNIKYSSAKVYCQALIYDRDKPTPSPSLSQDKPERFPPVPLQPEDINSKEENEPYSIKDAIQNKANAEDLFKLYSIKDAIQNKANANEPYSIKDAIQNKANAEDLFKLYSIKDAIQNKANAEDLFKLLEAIVYLSKNTVYQNDFNKKYQDGKFVSLKSYIDDLKCYVALISSAENSPVKNSSQAQDRVAALFYRYLGEAYEKLADSKIDSEENYKEAKDSYIQSSESSQNYKDIQLVSLKNLADLYKKNGKNQDAISLYKKIADSLQKTVEKTESNTDKLTLDQKRFIEENILNIYQNIIALLWDDSSKSEDIIQYIELSRINSEFAKNPTSNSCLPSSSNDNDVIPRLQCLPAKTTLIEYFVAKDDRVYAVVINKQNEGDKYKIELPIAKKYLGMEKELTSQIEQFYQYDLTAGVQACQQSDGKSDQLCQPQSLGKLYDILIKPIKDQIKTTNLIIVPHRILHNLPFASLYDSQNKQYLIEKYAISILPSIYSLATISPSKNAVEDLDNIRVVALANPTFDLLNSQIEVETIKELKSRKKNGKFLYNFRNPLYDENLGNPLYGKNATLENLERNLNNENTNILHLSTHSEVDHSNALITSLLLNGDINLQATDIKNLSNVGKLNLVVLSACETNVGEITKGDAVFNLTNSFLDKGVSSVVSSLWNVDDQATSDLMENFYTKLANPETTKAEALQNAQVNLLKNNQYRHPYYWGAFLLTGDSSPLIGK
jgi:CHAT domain-containing protein